jgi:hypothetical protein
VFFIQIFIQCNDIKPICLTTSKSNLMFFRLLPVFHLARDGTFLLPMDWVCQKSKRLELTCVAQHHLFHLSSAAAVLSSILSMSNQFTGTAQQLTAMPMMMQLAFTTAQVLKLSSKV